MTDRDRLIELIFKSEYSDFPCHLNNVRIEDFADYLLANGVTLGKPLVEYLHPIDAYEGLKGKYLVFKADTGEQIVNCFVLRPDKDNTAAEALRFYAYTTENETLAEDIYKWVGKSKILPPCKVGDTVWSFLEDNRLFECEVKQFYIDKKEIGMTYEPKAFRGRMYGVNIRTFGKTVFLTKEEAKAKLKELNDNAKM